MRFEWALKSKGSSIKIIIAEIKSVIFLAIIESHIIHTCSLVVFS